MVALGDPRNQYMFKLRSSQNRSCWSTRRRNFFELIPSQLSGIRFDMSKSNENIERTHLWWGYENCLDLYDRSYAVFSLIFEQFLIYHWVNTDNSSSHLIQSVLFNQKVLKFDRFSIPLLDLRSIPIRFRLVRLNMQFYAWYFLLDGEDVLSWFLKLRKSARLLITVARFCTVYSTKTQRKVNSESSRCKHITIQAIQTRNAETTYLRTIKFWTFDLNFLHDTTFIWTPIRRPRGYFESYSGTGLDSSRVVCPFFKPKSTFKRCKPPLV